MYPPFPPSFHIGPLTIHWYGIIMVTAIFVAALIASRYVARRGQDSNTIWSMLLWVVVPAILGARLYYVFIQAPRGPDGLGNYLAHPWLILAIWQGGIHIYGALIGGGIALLTYVYVKKLPPLIYLDAVGLGLLLGQSIGRLGNFMNQELYGPPTKLPWGLRIDPAYRLAPYNNLTLYPESTRFQPLFLYEMIWNLIGFSLIFWISRRFEKKLRDGDIVLMYLIWYPFGRFFLEFFRTDSWFFPGTPFDLVHLLSAIVVIGSILLLIQRHRNWSGRPAVESVTVGGTTTEPEEVTIINGIDMSEEYTFLEKHPRTLNEEQEELEKTPTEELIEEKDTMALEEGQTEEFIDEKDTMALEAESEGTEDVEDGDGASAEEEFILEEGEDFGEDTAKLTNPRGQTQKTEEDEEDEEDEEEGDGDTAEEGADENVDEASNVENTEEGSVLESPEEGAVSSSASESAEENVVENEAAGEETEESTADEAGVEEEVESTEDDGDATDDGSADASSDE